MAKFFTPSKLSENIKTTPEGFLLCLNVPIARTGWQDYGPGETPLEIGSDGVVWVYRDSKEVFRPQTIASFNAKSMTIKHPEDFVTPENWKELTVGMAQNIRRGDEKDEDGEEMLLADLLFTDKIAIGLIKNGLREVSCGYDAEYEQTGEGEGKQFNIIGNHIALVEQGRAGSAYAIKDHKGKVDEIMSLKDIAEKIKNLGKTVDEAVAASEKPVDKKKTKDGDATPEQVTYDDLVKCVKDLSEKINGAKKADDEDMPEKKDKSEDDEESDIGSRLSKLEAAVAQILEKLGNKGAEDEEEEKDKSEDEESEKDMSGDEDMEESEDEDMEESEDAEGEEAEESQKKSKSKDAASIEILTPGKKFTGDDARLKCLKSFAKTEDGAKVLAQLGMKKPVLDAKSNVDMIFMAATALVKTKRGVGLDGTKDGRKWKAEDAENTASTPVTAEQMNAINAKHYGVAK